MNAVESAETVRAEILADAKCLALQEYYRGLREGKDRSGVLLGFAIAVSVGVGVGWALPYRPGWLFDAARWICDMALAVLG